MRTRSSVLLSGIIACRREPFVDDQRVARVALIEVLQRLGPLRYIMLRQSRRAPAMRSGHIVGGAVLLRLHARWRPVCRRRRRRDRAPYSLMRAGRRWPRPGCKGCRALHTVGRCQPGLTETVADFTGADAARAREMASGSISRPISRAISASAGSVSASETKAGSSLLSARMAASAAIRPSSARHSGRHAAARHFRSAARRRAFAQPASD